MLPYKQPSSLAEPMVLYCELEHPSAGGWFGPIIRQIYIIECNVSGYGTVTINDKTFPVTPGDCYVLFPGDTVTHTADAVEPRSGYWCSVDGLSLERHFRSAGLSAEAPFAPKEAFAEIRGWMEKMVDSWQREDFGAQLVQTACVYGILSALHRSKKIADREFVVEKAIGLMETNYANDLNVTRLAQMVGLARTYFSTRFKQETGMTPHKYLETLRMQKACLLLEGRENYSIREVAFLVGADPKNFATQFKKHVGKTPLQYKRANKAK